MTTLRKSFPDYLRLVAFLFCVWLLVFESPKLLKRMTFVKKFYAVVERKNIDVTALFYSDEIKTSDSEKEIARAINTKKEKIFLCPDSN